MERTSYWLLVLDNSPYTKVLFLSNGPICLAAGKEPLPASPLSDCPGACLNWQARSPASWLHPESFPPRYRTAGGLALTRAGGATPHESGQTHNFPVRKRPQSLKNVMHQHCSRIWSTLDARCIHGGAQTPADLASPQQACFDMS